MRLESESVESCIEVRSCVRPTVGLVLWTAIKILLVGVGTTVLVVILGFVCGIAIPLLGGPPGVAIAGSLFCSAWGAMIGGGKFATRCRIVGLISLLIAAGLVIGTMFLAMNREPKNWVDAAKFALGMAVGGGVVGAALGKVAGGKRMVFMSTVIGMLAWLLASMLTVSAVVSGGAAGPTMLFGLMFTPGIGLTVWGIVMGARLARCPAMTETDLSNSAEFPNLDH